MKTQKEAERDREVEAASIVHAVIEELRGFGMIADVPDVVRGQAIMEAAQRIEYRLPLVR